MEAKENNRFLPIFLNPCFRQYPNELIIPILPLPLLYRL